MNKILISLELLIYVIAGLMAYECFKAENFLAVFILSFIVILRLKTKLSERLNNG